MERKKNLGVAIALMLVIIHMTGARLPYIYTTSSLYIRIFVVFPLVMAAFLWLIFFIKWRPSGATGYRMAIERAENPGDKVKFFASLLVILPICSAGIASSSIDLAAVAAVIAPAEQVSALYRVTGQKIVQGDYRVQMIDISKEESASVRLSGFKRGSWRAGDVICVKGRHSIFGTVVDAIEANGYGAC